MNIVIYEIHCLSFHIKIKSNVKNLVFITFPNMNTNTIDYIFLEHTLIQQMIVRCRKTTSPLPHTHKHLHTRGAGSLVSTNISVFFFRFELLLICFILYRNDEPMKQVKFTTDNSNLNFIL